MCVSHSRCGCVGIIKPGAAVFTAASQDEGVLRVFAEECVERDALLTVVSVSR